MAHKESCVVIVTIELGHQANFLNKPSAEGFTHDWTVFVRGYEGSKLEHFVEKVVFRLHKTFKMPIRKIHEPPYRVSESGYAGFILPIEVHFKNKQTPRKISFEYDLFLNAPDRPPISNVRYEKLKFQNPTPEFKAKLIKAGGIEQSSESVPQHIPDMFGSPTKTGQEGKKIKSHKTKKSKTSPPVKAASPATSLSSLSPLSSEDEKKEVLSFKKEKEPPMRKEFSFKSESCGKSKSKHKSSSSSHKKKHSSDKEREKVHEKDKERSSHSHQKESSKKDRESSSQKSRESSDSFKERDDSYSFSKGSSSHSEKKISSSSSFKEKLSSMIMKEKDVDVVVKEKHKGKSEKSGKEKCSLHKEHHKSAQSAETSKKSKEGFSKEKSSKHKEKHKSSLKRSGSPLLDVESAKKSKKTTSSLGSDVKPVKQQVAEKERSVSNVSREIKEGKERESKTSTQSSNISSSQTKMKHEKSKHSDKSKHKSHASDAQRKGSEDRDFSQKVKDSKPEKTVKSEKNSKSSTSSKSDHLGLSADFQPTLLLSPLKNKSDDEDASHSKPSGKTVKRSKSTSSLNSSSSLSSHNASDSEDVPVKEDKAKQIVSGLTDSDSDSEEDNEICSSPQKEIKSALSKHDVHGQPFLKSKTDEVAMKDEQTTDTKMKVSASKHSEEKKRSKGHDVAKHRKKKTHERDKKKDHESTVVPLLSKTVTDEVKHERDILAPNGLSIGELISINEKIEKLQVESNTNLLLKIIDVISDANEYDIDDSALFFDICSLDKSIVSQIQNVLRD